VIHKDDIIRFHNRVCVPAAEELKKKILDEGHNTPHSIHPGENKLYKDMKLMFWWSSKNQEVTNYAAKCLTYQREKVEHQWPAGLLQQLNVPE